VSTSERILGLLAAFALVALAAHCSAGGECLRYSDCGDGLTCSDGRCVAPSGGADASLDAEADGGDASSADAMTTDAAKDSGGPAEAATHDAPSDASQDAQDCADGGCPGDGGTSGDARSDSGAAADASSD